jgi:hypothetical protein
MRAAAWFFLIIGIFLLLTGVAIDTTVFVPSEYPNRVHNIGLLNHQLGCVIVGSIFILIGVVAEGFYLAIMEIGACEETLHELAKRTPQMFMMREKHESLVEDIPVEYLSEERPAANSNVKPNPSDATTRFQCPTCLSEYNFSSSMKGRTALCRECGKTFCIGRCSRVTECDRRMTAVAGKQG